MEAVTPPGVPGGSRADDVRDLEMERELELLARLVAAAGAASRPLTQQEIDEALRD